MRKIKTHYIAEFYDKYHKVLEAKVRVYGLGWTKSYSAVSELEHPGDFSLALEEEPKAFDTIHLKMMYENSITQYWVILGCRAVFQKDEMNEGWGIHVRYESYITGITGLHPAEAMIEQLKGK